MDSDSDSGDGEEYGGSLVGFLFGNVDKDMQLEDDYMDEVRFWPCQFQLHYIWPWPNAHMRFLEINLSVVERDQSFTPVIGDVIS